MKREYSHRVRPRHGGCRNARPHTGIRAGTWLTVLTTAIVPPGHLQLHAAGLDLDGHLAAEAIRSKERAAELYVSALQLVAGEFLDLITGDVTGTLRDRLADGDTSLPDMQGGLAEPDRRRFHALGLRVAAAGGQLAAWVVPGSLRGNVDMVDIELAADRLSLGMVGRIRGGEFRRDGVAPIPVSLELLSRLPPNAVGVIVAAHSPADVLEESSGALQRRRPCPDGSYGFGIREERMFRRTVTGTGESGTEWTGDWTETSSDCHPEGRQAVLVAEACPGLDSGWITYRVEQQVMKHPEHPYRFRVIRDETGPGNEIARYCAGNGKQLVSETTIETRRMSLACDQVHAPVKLVPSEPDYSGSVHYERRFRVVTSSFAGDEDPGVSKSYPIDADWREVSEDCSRIMTRQTSRQETVPCPASHPTGIRYRAESGVESYTDFLTGDDVSLGIAWNQDWKETANSCHKTWTAPGSPEHSTRGCDRYQRSVTRYWSEFERDRQSRVEREENGDWVHIGTIPGCRIDRDQGGGRDDSDREEPNNGWDVDGDGRADFDNQDEAENHMSDQGLPGQPKPIADGCGGGCWGPTNPEPSGGNDNGNGGDDDDGGGGGWCFLTTAVISMRGEADEGPTLTTLRRFRDGWLAETADGRALIAEYHVLAPGIVSAIPEGHADWSWIADQVDSARDAILAGMNDRALAIYVGMVRRLQEQWL
ncbi:MAG: hypothetical protein OXF56_24530 [Rhodobacteraceae bacterium]|nr:hypothetical protein [Paracoccaceae bacterium]